MLKDLEVKSETRWQRYPLLRGKCGLFQCLVNGNIVKISSRDSMSANLEIPFVIKTSQTAFLWHFGATR